MPVECIKDVLEKYANAREMRELSLRARLRRLRFARGLGSRKKVNYGINLHAKDTGQQSDRENNGRSSPGQVQISSGETLNPKESDIREESRDAKLTSASQPASACARACMCMCARGR